MKKEEWFANWFDTPFYHILYKNRNFVEAEEFITNLLKYLKPKKQSKILDLACGKGRHAYFIAKNDLTVEGVDLSEQSIQSAKQHFQLDHLSFSVHDMRESYKKNHFDYVFNFFTSFGYFESDQENQDVIQAMSANLKPGGCIVIDFLNVNKAKTNLLEKEVKNIDNIEFTIHKKIENNSFIKKISFQHQDKDYVFEERVNALNLENFETYFKASELSLKQVFGNYQLEDFNAKNSDRLIMLVQKNV